MLRHRLPVLDVAAGAVQCGREAPRRAGTALRIEPEDREAATARLQRVLDCLDRAGRRLSGPLPGPIRSRSAMTSMRSGCSRCSSGVALTGEQLDDFRGGEPRGHRDLEGHHDPVESGVLDRTHDRLRRVATHRRPAAPAVQHGGTREEQLQVVVELRHGADRRARGSHRVGLVDGDRGRDAVDAACLVEPWFVHPVEKLARVGRERLDVAALPFAVDGVEGERGLAGTAHPGDDVQLAEREVEIHALEIVLAGAANSDGWLPVHCKPARAWRPIRVGRPGAERTSPLSGGSEPTVTRSGAR